MSCSCEIDIFAFLFGFYQTGVIKWLEGLECQTFQFTVVLDAKCDIMTILDPSHVKSFFVNTVLLHVLMLGPIFVLYFPLQT